MDAARSDDGGHRGCEARDEAADPYGGKVRDDADEEAEAAEDGAGYEIGRPPPDDLG